MSELGRVLRLDARRAALLIAVPLLTGIGIVTVWLSLVPGVAYWDNSVVALINAVRLLGPVAAGLAAWAAVRERGLNYLRDLSPRSPATGALVDLLLLAAAAVLAYATITAVLIVETMLRQEAGHPDPLGVLAGASGLVLHVVAGYLAARVAPRPATAAAVMAVTWSWAAARTPGASWWSLLPPAALDHVEPFTGLRSRVLADQTVWALAVTATLVLAYVGWVTRRAAVAVPLVAALALAGFATARLQSSDGSAVGAAPVGLACREWPLRVCVHPALRSALPALTAAATPLATRLSGTPGEFTQVVQRPRTEPVAVVRGTATVHLDSELSPGYETRVVRQIKNALADPEACQASRAPGGGEDPAAARAAGGTPPARSAEYGALVDAWLLGAQAPPISDQRTAYRFGGWSEEQKREWLRTNYPRYRSCALAAGDFRLVVTPPPAQAPRPSPRPLGPGLAHDPA
ncbi:hypothetical protein [Actinomadura rugatobispora]|uniref:Uncharacterized protein n=1 Tax=Actinomadura rugatobispora TaxID=1994 RepID=A0ABW0ZRQ6_9ACTN|nr:hypothetical protein GCM10010200_059890 [Actinomadura rugatobispora]